MTPEDKEEMQALLDEYKEKKDAMFELEQDIKVLRSQLLVIFNENKITQKEYKNILYKINNRKIYTYPSSCKKHATLSTSKDYIVMYDHTHTPIYKRYKSYM